MRLVYAKPGYRGTVWWMTNQCFSGMELPDREDFDKAYDRQEVFIAHEFDQPEGYAMILMGDGKVKGCYLQSIAVLPDYRGYGLGSWLIQEVAHYCRSKNETCIYLHCKKNSSVVEFYKKEGFVPRQVIKNHYLSEGDGLEMVKKL